MSDYRKIHVALHIVGQVMNNEKVRTSRDINTEYDRQEMMKWRSALLDSCVWLSQFKLPSVFREEIERIFEKCKDDHWTLPVIPLMPHIPFPEFPTNRCIDSIQAVALAGDFDDPWERVMIAEQLQKIGLLRYTNVGEPFFKFWEADRKASQEA